MSKTPQTLGYTIRQSGPAHAIFFAPGMEEIQNGNEKADLSDADLRWQSIGRYFLECLKENVDSATAAFTCGMISTVEFYGLPIPAVMTAAVVSKDSEADFGADPEATFQRKLVDGRTVTIALQILSHESAMRTAMTLTSFLPIDDPDMVVQADLSINCTEDVARILELYLDWLNGLEIEIL